MMNEEWKKMLRGEPYHALDPEILSMLFKTKDAVWAYNQLKPSQLEARETCIKRILGHCGVQPMVNSPFYCDFGCNIHVGDHFFSNFNLTILDEARVTIGNHVLIGPNVSLFTACHPIDPEERRLGMEWAKPITIGDDVWIGGNVTILPGVTIGQRCTIGAGSVVTKDIPANSIAVGNPCHVIKKLPSKK
jgi:maltose O-acetyltransferase